MRDPGNEAAAHLVMVSTQTDHFQSACRVSYLPALPKGEGRLRGVESPWERGCLTLGQWWPHKPLIFNLPLMDTFVLLDTLHVVKEVLV